jgi:hypothetical protein
MFKKDDIVIYTKKGHQIARIMFIHYDDVKPYYTIFIRSEKKEIQTVAKYLKKCYKTRKKLRCKRSQSKKK